MPHQSTKRTLVISTRRDRSKTRRTGQDGYPIRRWVYAVMVRNDGFPGRETQRHKLGRDLDDSVYDRLGGGKRSREESWAVSWLTESQVGGLE